MSHIPKPKWLEDEKINEVLFCTDFLAEHPMLSVNGQFFTHEGRISDEDHLRKMIYDILKPYITTNLMKKVTNLLEVLRLECCSDELPLQQDRIHVANGTLFLNDHFIKDMAICQNRLPVSYQPKASPPKRWLAFLEDLLNPQDIPVLQEYLGYCLIPSTKAQKMMIISGSGGEGKSQIGRVMQRLLGSAMLTNSIQKIETNRFARADLEGRLLMTDDDMDINALPKTNNLKTIVTAEVPIDLERKGLQSYQRQLYCRFLCFGNGELAALNDSSKGFYRRQLVLYTKDPTPNRKNDPYLAEKMMTEVEGIFLWALEGLKRLIRNDYCFSFSSAIENNLSAIQSSTNTVESFMTSTGYIEFHADASASTKDIYDVYKQFCWDNSFHPVSSKQFSSALNQYARKYNLESTNNIILSDKRRVRGYLGIQLQIQVLF